MAHTFGVFDYYDDPGARSLAHQVKSGDLNACQEVADKICAALQFSPGTTLVPVPSRRGYATNNLTICLMIAKKMNIDVNDCLAGEARPSLYDLKKQAGSPGDLNVKFHAKGALPTSPCIIFDAVCDSGLTINAALSVFSDQGETHPECLSFTLVNKHKMGVVSPMGSRCFSLRAAEAQLKPHEPCAVARGSSDRGNRPQI